MVRTNPVLAATPPGPKMNWREVAFAANAGVGRSRVKQAATARAARARQRLAIIRGR